MLVSENRRDPKASSRLFGEFPLMSSKIHWNIFLYLWWVDTAINICIMAKVTSKSVAVFVCSEEGSVCGGCVSAH